MVVAGSGVSEGQCSWYMLCDTMKTHLHNAFSNCAPQMPLVSLLYIGATLAVFMCSDLGTTLNDSSEVLNISILETQNVFLMCLRIAGLSCWW